MKTYLGLVALLLLAAGCASSSARLECQRDPKLEISRQSRFTIRYEADKSIEHRRIHQMLTDEFARQGLTLVEEPQAEFVIWYELSSSTTRMRDYRPYTSTEHYSGRLNGKEYHGSATSTEYLPYEADITSRTLRVVAARNAPGADSLVSAWEGILTADKEAFDTWLEQGLRLMVRRLPETCRETTALARVKP